MRKIAMVGTSGTGHLAPYDDPSWEIWGVSSRGPTVTRADRWFELHRLDGEPKQWAKDWRQHLRERIHDVPLYMIYPEPDLAKEVIQFPVDKIMDRFGTFFLTSTFSWIIALAIDELRPLDGEDVDGEIGIWGVDMEFGTEYETQRPGIRHYMELCKFAGIPVMRLAGSGIAYDPVPYPMLQDDPMLCKIHIRMASSEETITNLNESIRKTRTLIAQNRALVQGLGMFGDAAKAPAEIERLNRECEGLIAESASLSKDMVHWEATREEQGWMQDYLTA